MTDRSATVCVPGTCGELVQGMIDGTPVLVSCPIDMYSQATVSLLDMPARTVIAPRNAPKAEAALRVTLDYFSFTHLGVRLELASSLPRAKGMASSTADVAASIFALAAVLDVPISPFEVGRLALSVEPSDATMFPNIALFDHCSGTRYEDLGPPPPMEIAVLDFGGTVDTVAFHRDDRSGQLRQNEGLTEEALALVRRGIREGNTRLIGEGATLSAQAHQAILYKPMLEPVIALAREVGTVGVNVAHSGTVIGVLVDPKLANAEEIALLCRRRFPSLRHTYSCLLIAGGRRQSAAVSRPRDHPLATV